MKGRFDRPISLNTMCRPNRARKVLEEQWKKTVCAT